MGTKAISILGLDCDKLVALLNKAYADEWLAHYQYWLGAKLAVGPMKGEVVAELEQHAADELRHAGMLAERIIQLGGTPISSPADWYKVTNCGYDAPEIPHVMMLLEQNIKGEGCAITVYKHIIDITNGTDPVTYSLALEILKDEIEHEEDLENLADDIMMSMCTCDCCLEECECDGEGSCGDMCTCGCEEEQKPAKKAPAKKPAAKKTPARKKK